MTKRNVGLRKKTPETEPVSLAPGLHAGSIELRSEGVFRVRLLDGTVIAATLDDGVDPELARECQRRGLRVIVTGSARGPLILGAIQTTPSIAVEEGGTLAISAKKIRLKAEQSLVLESGEASLRLQPDGVFKLEGDRMVVDVAGLVRFLSARVEFP
jgi:hypothetical protein